ncbi:MAG: hypothetical protein ACTSX9_04495 [Candidatus Njordarchaeales archaeon]
MATYSYKKVFAFYPNFNTKEEAISEILENCEEETRNYVLELCSDKLLLFNIESEVLLQQQVIEVILELHVIVSPLTPLVTQEKNIADVAAERFFGCFEKRLRAHGKR